MTPEPLPPDVAAFIGDHLLSLDEIEVLTAMRDLPDRWWDARLIYAELGIPVAAARGLLDHLAGLNLFDIRVTDEVRYRFQPGTAELAQTVSRLVAIYRTNRTAVVEAIAPVARRGVLDFANAFRLRDKDGTR
jgi:hypothetical protein